MFRIDAKGEEERKKEDYLKKLKNWEDEVMTSCSVKLEEEGKRRRVRTTEERGSDMYGVISEGREEKERKK